MMIRVKMSVRSTGSYISHSEYLKSSLGSLPTRLNCVRREVCIVQGVERVLYKCAVCNVKGVHILLYMV